MLDNRYQYYFPKFKYTRNDVSYIYLTFENGDFLQIKSSEIINLSINVYDRLIRSHRGYNPVVESGFLKLKICNKHSFKNTNHLLYNEEEFLKDRKLYIENRCVNESVVKEVRLFNRNDECMILHCDTKAKIENDLLIIEFLKQPQMGSFSSDNHNFKIGNLNKKIIDSIDLDFENTESFVVYNSEIQEINLEFYEKLQWEDGGLHREIKSGYIIIKLDKENEKRTNVFIDEEIDPQHEDFERRLVGENGKDYHDLCHLYIDFSSDLSTECITINDIRLNREEFIDVFFDEEDVNSNYEDKNDAFNYEEIENDDDDYWFISGYCKKLEDGSIIIAFGENSEELINNFTNNIF